MCRGPDRRRKKKSNMEWVGLLLFLFKFTFSGGWGMALKESWELDYGLIKQQEVIVIP